MAINEAEHKSWSSSEGKRMKRASRSKRQNNFKEMPTPIGPIVQKQWAPAKRSQENAGYWRLCLNRAYETEEFSIVPLKVRLTIFQQRENNKGNIS